MSQTPTPEAPECEPSRKNLFALSRFLIIGAKALLLCWAVLAGCWLLEIVTELDDLIGFAGVGVFIGLVAVGLCYAKAMHQSLVELHLSPRELAPSEVVLLQTTRSMVHQSGWWFGARGGRLFLTSRRIVFLPHGGQFHAHPVHIPLDQIDCVIPFGVLGSPPCGILVAMRNRRQERFGFGLINGPLAEEWTLNILAARTYLLSGQATFIEPPDA